MKLFFCRLCGHIDALKYEPRRCECGNAGGMYNADGDTATVWGDSVGLLGLHNRRVQQAVFGLRLNDFSGDDVLWPYPMDNGKITRIERPASL